jgi:hypothetical protein
VGQRSASGDEEQRAHESAARLRDATNAGGKRRAAVAGGARAACGDRPLEEPNDRDRQRERDRQAQCEHGTAEAGNRDPVKPQEKISQWNK